MRAHALMVRSPAMTQWRVFEDAFPIVSERTSLELVEVKLQGDEDVRLVVRLFVWDGEGEARAVRDIKEQDVFVGPVTIVEDPRLAACVAGWRLAIERLFAQDDARWYDRVDSAMPHELVPVFAELLALKRPRDADDFAEALLGSKQRFGRYLVT